MFAFVDWMRNSYPKAVYGRSMSQNKIKEARDAKGWTQQHLAERMGTTQQTIQRYEKGTRNLKASVLAQLSEVLDVTVAYLLGMSDGDAPRADSANIPLYGSIAAGRPLEMESAEALYPVPADVCNRWPNAFLLRVEGESMNRILPNGCYALVDPCTEADHDNQPYAVRVGDQAATIKRVHKLPNGLQLIPDSNDPTFQPQTFDLSIKGAPTLSVIGRVVWHCIPYDWSY